MNTTTCDKCKRKYGIGQSPWCRDNHEFGYGGYGAFTPYTDEMIGPEPVHFGNWGEKIRYMDRHGIESHEHHRHKPSKIYSR